MTQLTQEAPIKLNFVRRLITLAPGAMNHLTFLDRRNWNRGDGTGPDTFVNNRVVQGWAYDADGRATGTPAGAYVYDAAGRVVLFGDSVPYQSDQAFTGNGLKAKTVARRFDDDLNDWVTEKVTYYLTSSVLGGALVSELSDQGAKERTLVYAGGSVLASQIVADGTESVNWEHSEPSGGSYRTTDASGAWSAFSGSGEMDAVGANAGLFKPFSWTVPDKKGLPVPYPGIADMLTNPGGGCVLDHMPIPCEIRNQLMESGGVRSEYPELPLIQDPNQDPRAEEKRWVRQSAPIENYGLGLFGIWMPTDLHDDRHVGGYVIYAFPQNSRQQAIDAAVTDALSILSTDNSCSQFFGGVNSHNGSRDGTEVLRELAKVLKPGSISAVDTTTGIQLSNFGNVRNTTTALEYQMPASAIVNQRGPFFGSNSFGSFSSTSRAGRALAILHEVAHLIKMASVIEFDDNGLDRQYDLYLIPEDGGKTDLSRANTSRNTPISLTPTRTHAATMVMDSYRITAGHIRLPVSLLVGRLLLFIYVRQCSVAGLSRNMIINRDGTALTFMQAASASAC